MKFIAKLLGTSFGFGYAPVAPGTFGTLFGVFIYLLIYHFYPEFINYYLLVLSIAGTVIGTWCCHMVAEDWGHDPGKIVLDESVGIWITMLFIPFHWGYILAAFVLFRFFDILKPLGIKKLDRDMDTPLSVMLDDVLAGIYAWIVLQLIIRAVPYLS